MWFAFREDHGEPNSLLNQLLAAGFKSVSKADRQIIINALNLLDNAPQTGFTHFKQRLRLRRQMDSLPKGQLTAHDMQQLKSLLAQCREMQVTQKYNRLFDSGAFWTKQFDAVRKDRKAYRRVMKLSGQWLAEGRYMRYSTLDLLSIYKRLLPLFANWLNYAEEELLAKSHRLNSALITEYSAYLEGLSQELQMEQKKIRLALLERLTAFTEPSVFINPVLALIHQLQQWVGNTSSEPIELQMVAREAMTPKQFKKIRHLIEKEGDPAEKATLYTLPIYQDLLLSQASEILLDPNTPHRKTHRGYVYYLPPTIHPHIPLEPPFYLRLPSFLWGLFKAEHIRYYFFQHHTCQFLLMMKLDTLLREKALSADTPMVNLTTTAFWQLASKRLSYLAAEKQRTQAAQASLISFFHRDTYQILNTYHHWLQQETTQVLSQQMQQLSGYFEIRAKTQPLTEIDRIQLEGLIESLETQNHQWGNPLGVELTMLRSHLLDTTDLPDTFLLALLQKPVEQMTIFERFYKDVFKVI